MSLYMDGSNTDYYKPNVEYLWGEEKPKSMSIRLPTLSKNSYSLQTNLDSESYF